MSSSRRAVEGKTPPVIGTVTFLPVRSSMIVMVSGTGSIPFMSNPLFGLFVSVEAFSSDFKDNQKTGLSSYPQDSKRHVVVFAIRKNLAFVNQCGQGRTDHRASFAGIDHGVDKASFSTDVWI